MAERQRLATERVALLMHDMRLRYGEVVRGATATVLNFTGRCIDCGQEITAGERAHTAVWRERSHITGHWAHTSCPPLESDWLRDESFAQVFDYFVRDRHNCAWCGSYDRASVRAIVPAPLDRFPRGGIILNYICGSCAEKEARPR